MTGLTACLEQLPPTVGGGSVDQNTEVSTAFDDFISTMTSEQKAMLLSSLAKRSSSHPPALPPPPSSTAPSSSPGQNSQGISHGIINNYDGGIGGTLTVHGQGGTNFDLFPSIHHLQSQ